MIATETIAGRVRALRELVGEDLADWLDVDPEELDRVAEGRPAHPGEVSRVAARLLEIAT